MHDLLEIHNEMPGPKNMDMSRMKDFQKLSLKCSLLKKRQILALSPSISEIQGHAPMMTITPLVPRVQK